MGASGRPGRRVWSRFQRRASARGRRPARYQGGALRRPARRRIPGEGPRPRRRPRQPGHGGTGEPGMDGPGDRSLRRQDCRRPGCPRHHPRRPGLDQGRRGPLGRARPPRGRRLRPVRRDRCDQGRHAPGPQRRTPAPDGRENGQAGGRLRRHFQPRGSEGPALPGAARSRRRHRRQGPLQRQLHPARGARRRRPPLAATAPMTHTHDAHAAHDPNNPPAAVQATGAGPVRQLPGHIAAALAGAGGATDSAGQPWAGRSLSGDDAKIHNFDDDDGTADAGYLAALSGLAAGTGDEAAVVAALATARVFVPILAQLAEEGEAAAGPNGDPLHDDKLLGDKQADMALVTLKAPDGRTAMPVFTSAASLTAWHPEARPVAVYAARAALSAVAEGAELLVLDPGSEVTFVVRRPAVWALAQQQPWTPSYADPDLAGALGEGAVGFPAVRRVEIHPGGGVASATADGRRLPGGGAGPELRVVLYLEDGLAAAEVQSLVAGLNENWA